jgi:hypothetical protein
MKLHEQKEERRPSFKGGREERPPLHALQVSHSCEGGPHPRGAHHEEGAHHRERNNG